MDCVIREVVALDRSGICPFAGAKCDGTMKINWGAEYALLPENKVCLSQGQRPVFIEIQAGDLEKVRTGSVLMIRTAGGGTCFVKEAEDVRL